jgi:hypothetical protein
MSRRLGEDVQDKDEAVARTINWAPDLDGGTISSVTWETSGLTNQSVSETDSTASIRLAGGVPGQVYPVTCRITTSLGETLEAYFVLTIDN